MGNPFATEAEIKVLTILAENIGLYGLEIVRQSRGAVKRGGVYVILSRLEERGLVWARVKRAGNPGLPRPCYGITEAGERMLKAWLQVNQTGGK